MSKVWGWIVAAVVFTFGVAAAIYFRALGDKRAAAQAKANAIEKNATRAIAAKRARVAKLKKDLERNKPKIARLEASVKADKRVLSKKFKLAGISAKDIAARLNKIHL